jgi:hypothetical protein
MNERARLEIMFNAVDTLPRALCRFDHYGDWCTVGRDGHVFTDGKACLIVVMTGQSVRC